MAVARNVSLVAADLLAVIILEGPRVRRRVPPAPAEVKVDVLLPEATGT